MADWAGAYGAGGAADALQQILVNKLMQAKFDEQKRQALAQEAAQAAERQARADEFRQAQGQRMTEFVADRDARYQDQTFRVKQMDAETQRQSLADQIRAKERAEEKLAKDAEREDEQAFRAGELRSRQDFERSMLNATRGGGPSPKDQIELERARLQLEAEKAKQAQAGKDRETQTKQASETTQSALDSVDALLGHGGLDSTYGNWEMRRGRTQASADFMAQRNKLVGMLALPNLGLLKGPMSDKDLLFIKQISSTLSDDNISEEAARDELQKVRTWLIEKGAAPKGQRAQAAPGADLGKDW